MNTIKERNFWLHFGAISDPIKKQLKDQGLKFDKHTVNNFQKDADAVARLRIRSLLSPTVIRTAEQRIMQNIAGHLHLQNYIKPNHNAK